MDNIGKCFTYYLMMKLSQVSKLELSKKQTKVHTLKETFVSQIGLKHLPLKWDYKNPRSCN